MADFTGNAGDNLFVFTGLTIGDDYDGLGGQDTIDASSNTSDYTFDLANERITLAGSFLSATLQNFEEVIGGSGDEVLLGSNGAAINSLDGGIGNDTISPGSDGIRTGDSYLGGNGALDLLDLSLLTSDVFYDSVSQELTSGSHTAVAFGFESFEGGSGDDFVRINAPLSLSVVRGNLGNDTISPCQIALNGKEFDGGEGIDQLDFSTFLASYDVNLSDGVFEIASINIVSTINGFEQINAGSGDDTLRSGEDTSQTYSIWGRDGDDAIFGGAGRDVLAGGRDNDRIFGGTNQDTLKGNSGNDTLDGQGGNDSIVGQAGRDALTGGNGDDRLKGGGNADSLEGGNGDDFLKGGTSNDFGFGGDDEDLVSGNAGNDTLRGDAGDDTLRGGGGNDELMGGTGNDTLKGGTGGDEFIFLEDHDQDVILDFLAAADRLTIDDGLLSGQTSGAAIVDAFGDVINGDLVLNFGGGDILTLRDFTDENALGGLIDIV